MSVSSHLNPEPERRLWIIHESVTASADRTDLRLGLLALVAVLETAAAFAALGACAPSYAVGLLGCAALLPALAALSPLAETPGQIPALDQTVGRIAHDDSFLSPRDLARYPHMELVIRLDKYLGGGITATRYYEDIVAKIIAASRAENRKRRLLLAACAPAVAAQFALAAGLLLRWTRP